METRSLQTLLALRHALRDWPWGRDARGHHL